MPAVSDRAFKRSKFGFKAGRVDSGPFFVRFFSSVRRVSSGNKAFTTSPHNTHDRRSGERADGEIRERPFFVFSRIRFRRPPLPDVRAWSARVPATVSCACRNGTTTSKDEENRTRLKRCAARGVLRRHTAHVSPV